MLYASLDVLLYSTILIRYTVAITVLLGQKVVSLTCIWAC
jgi:hypothetical protein